MDLERLQLLIPKKIKSQMKKAAAKQYKTMTAYLIEAVAEKLKQDNAADDKREAIKR